MAVQITFNVIFNNVDEMSNITVSENLVRR